MFIEFNGDITEKIQDDLLKLFSKLTPFEYEEEYLILEIEKQEIKFLDIEITIKDVTRIFPLSERAKTTIESRLDNRIHFESFNFSHLLNEIEKRDIKHQIKWGINAICTICDISEDRAREIISYIGERNIFKGIDKRKSFIKSEDYWGENYWEYLMIYERYEYFPNNTLGFFFDSGQIFVRSMKKQKSFEGSRFHDFLVRLNNEIPDIKIDDILTIFETEEGPHNFIEQNTIDHKKYFLISALFLRFKEEIRTKDDLKQVTMIKNRIFFDKPKLKESYEFAVILIGAFFGLNKFYDLFYDKLNLRFFKSPERRLMDKSYEHPKSLNIQTPEKQEEKPKFQIKRDKCIEIIEDVLIDRSSIEIKALIDIIKSRIKITVSQKELYEIIKEIKGIDITKKVVHTVNDNPKMNFNE